MIQDKLKNKKVRRIIIGIIIVLIIIIIIFTKGGNEGSTSEDITTENIEKRTLVSSISATGVIVSNETKNISTTLTGVQVKSINIEVGDVISVGDTICTFDTKDISENLKAAQNDLSIANSQSSISIQNAQRGLSDAIASRNITVSNAEPAKNAALNAYNAANAELQNAKAELAHIESVLPTYIQEADRLYQIHLADTSDVNAEIAYDNAKETLYSLNLQIDKIKNNIPSLEGKVNTTKSAYDVALSEYNNILGTQDSIVAGAQNGVSSAELSSTSSAIAKQDVVKAYQEQLEKGILTSTVSGVVTAVSIVEGDTYKGTTIATIEGSESFEIEAQIDQYDISDIQNGMKVSIKTDATRDLELSGTVTFTAPKATEVDITTGGTGGVSYQVKVSLDTPNDRLRLGMTAKLSIITEKKENVFSVPYDAILEKEDGTKCVYVMKDGSEQIEEISITTGMETSYYVEIISDKLAENMKVVIPEGDMTSIKELIEGMGATAGM